jgi:hypothetical protein
MNGPSERRVGASVSGHEEAQEFGAGFQSDRIAD